MRDQEPSDDVDGGERHSGDPEHRRQRRPLRTGRQYGADERDVVIVRVEVTGRKKGEEKKRFIYQVIDRRDLETGFTAMSRTVGYTASIGAQLIGSGKLTKRGLLSSINDVPYELLAQELMKRDVQITSRIAACEQR